jgi:hypothetical protein
MAISVPRGTTGSVTADTAPRVRLVSPVRVPENGFLDESGHAWKCDRGFAPSGSTCLRLQVPRDAHLDSTGNDWTCDWGFENRNGHCVANGNGWERVRKAGPTPRRYFPHLRRDGLCDFTTYVADSAQN